MNSTSPKASIDELVPRKRLAVRRLNRLGMLCVTLSLMSFLSGATALADVSTNYLDLAEIVSVLAFIGSMLALAFRMIGDAFRS